MATPTTPPLLSSTGGDAQAIINAVVGLHEPRTVDVTDGTKSAQVVAVPRDIRLESIKPFLDQYLTKPERRRGTATLGSLDSFIAHVNRFRDADSVVFAERDETKPSLTSVLDYHKQGANNEDARFGQHRGVYCFPLSEPWKVWAKVDGEPLSQAEFAAFLEERIMDIQLPPTDGRAEAGAQALDLVATLGGEIAGPTRLLETARGLRMQETSEVTNAQNLNTGETEIVFRTTHTDQAGGTLKVPSLFLVCIPVFDGDAAYRMPIRLRYRRKEGRIIWFIARYRPELVFFDAFDRAAARVGKETDLPVFMGKPEA